MPRKYPPKIRSKLSLEYSNRTYIFFDREQRSRGPKNYFVGEGGGGSEFEKTSEFKENRKLILIIAILHLGNAILHLGNVILHLGNAILHLGNAILHIGNAVLNL